MKKLAFAMRFVGVVGVLFGVPAALCISLIVVGFGVAWLEA